VTPREALDRIAALHVESDRDYDYPHVGTHCTTCSDDWPCATAAVLAEVSPESEQHACYCGSSRIPYLGDGRPEVGE
jgi:hypothetical protein